MTDLAAFHDALTRAVREQDSDRLATVIAPGFVIRYDTTLPFGGTYHGAAGLSDVLSRRSASMLDLSTTPLNYMEDAAAEQYTLVTALSAQVAGRPVSTLVSELWTVRDGRAVEARVWFWGAAELFRPRTRRAVGHSGPDPLLDGPAVVSVATAQV